MIALPEGLPFDDVHVYQRPDSPSAFLYIPGAPQPRLTSQGAPAVSLMAMGEMAFLTLEARWEVPPHRLDALEALLASSFPELAPGSLQLALAPVSVDQAQLMLGEEQDGAQELQATPTSGAHPFTALFSVQLDAGQRAQVLSALNGRRGVLRVVYRVRLEVPVVSFVTLAGDVSEEGRHESHLEATVRLAESVSLPLERTADVATWFEGRGGLGQTQPGAR